MATPSLPRAGDLVRRHALATRLWHWINALSVFTLLMSGATISNAHPRLYWGHYGANPDAAWAELPRFPGWMTIPSHYDLSAAREWHLAFAWVLAFGFLAFLLWAFTGRHFRRDLALSRREVAPRVLWHDIKAHARLHFPHGSEALRYNPIQKITYALVLFAMLPLLIASGLAMSPAMDAAWPFLVDLFGGRQSARSVHFILASAMALFILIHVGLVILSGPVNQLRAMVTGWYKLPGDAA